MSEPDIILIVFDVLQALGFFSLLLIAITAAMSRHVSRSPAWYSMILSGVVYTIAYLLIIGHQSGPDPPAMLCRVQAAFVYSTSVLAPWAVLGLVVQLYFTATAMIRTKPLNKFQTHVPLFLPPILSVAVLAQALVIGSKNPSVVQRSVSGMFCRLTDTRPVTTAAILAVIACILVLAVEGMTLFYLKTNWRAFRNLQTSNETVSLAMIVRIAAFSMIPIVATVTVLLFSFSRGSSWSEKAISAGNLVAACVPLTGALIFGTQKDILNVWLCRRRKPSSSDIHLRSIPSTHSNFQGQVSFPVMSHRHPSESRRSRPR